MTFLDEHFLLLPVRNRIIILTYKYGSLGLVWCISPLQLSFFFLITYQIAGKIKCCHKQSVKQKKPTQKSTYYMIWFISSFKTDQTADGDETQNNDFWWASV